MRSDFKISAEGKSCFAKNMDFAGTKFDVSISIGNTHTLEEIDWKHVDAVIEFLNVNYPAVQLKATEYIWFIVNNSDLYDEEDKSKIKGFTPMYVDITHTFGPYLSDHLLNYEIHFYIDSDFWIDTYGKFAVKFINNSAVGVQRIQW